MIKIKGVRTLKGTVEDVTIPGVEEKVIDANGKLIMLPALIDTFACFKALEDSSEKDWISGAMAAIAGGVTTVFAMPGSLLPCADLENLKAKKASIDKSLFAADIPLRYGLYIGAASGHIEALSKVKDQVAGIYVCMEQDAATLNRIFQIASQENMLVATNGGTREIALAEKYSTQLLIYDVGTKETLNLIREAKKRQILVYAATSPHHLFLTNNKGADREALFEAIHDRTLDMICSNHTPHTIMLPLLLDAYHERKLTLEEIVQITRINPEGIFNQRHNQDVVLVDLELEKKVKDSDMKTHTGSSSFVGRSLKGWPIYTIMQGRVYTASA